MGSYLVYSPRGFSLSREYGHKSTTIPVTSGVCAGSPIIYEVCKAIVSNPVLIFDTKVSRVIRNRKQSDLAKMVATLYSGI